MNRGSFKAAKWKENEMEGNEMEGNEIEGKRRERLLGLSSLSSAKPSQ
jgi:hypothetical protein